MSDRSYLTSTSCSIADKPLSVFTIATRADRIDDEQERTALVAMENAAKDLKGLLNLHTGSALDARKSDSTEMNDLRKGFAEVTEDILLVRRGTYHCKFLDV